MYNLLIVVALVMILFFLSHDKKFAKLFTKNTSFQVIAAIIVAYFSLNQINFGILLVVTVLMVLRYSYFNSNVLAPLKEKYKTPLIKDIHRIIEKFGDSDEEEEEQAQSMAMVPFINHIIENDRQEIDISAQNEELKYLFADLDQKMNSMINQ